MKRLVEQAYETARGWCAVGHKSVQFAQALIVREPASPRIYDANFAAAVRAESPNEIDALLGELDHVFDGLKHRHVIWDPDMPQPFEARLVLEGWRLQNDIVTLVLEGPLAAAKTDVAVRLVESEADWQVIEELHWLDHQEEVALGFHKPWGRDVTAQITATKRAKAPAVRYFLARIDGVDCGFFSAWAGNVGAGQIEDLFTRAEYRGRGVGSALIAACVADARACGAGPILVGARANDTPKHMYATLGFRPLCVQRSYLKLLE